MTTQTDSEWLRWYAEELMVLARGVSNMKRPESDNNYGREATRLRAISDTLDRITAENAALDKRLGQIHYLLTKPNDASSPEVGMGIVIAILEQVVALAAKDEGNAP